MGVVLPKMRVFRELGEGFDGAVGLGLNGFHGTEEHPAVPSGDDHPVSQHGRGSMGYRSREPLDAAMPLLWDLR